MRTDRYVAALSASPALTLIDGVRADGDVAGIVDEVRRILHDDGRTVGVWAVSDLATPADLVEHLQQHGLVLAEGGAFEPTGTGLVLDRAPDLDVPTDVTARVVTEHADVRTALDIQLRCNGVPDDVRPQWVEPMADAHDPTTQSLVLAELDGVPVASGSAVPTPHGVWLTGAGTLPEARGRGAYRALVAARWQQAVDAGTPALVVQAGSMSRPVLERMGFHAVGTITYLRDELA